MGRVTVWAHNLGPGWDGAKSSCLLKRLRCAPDTFNIIVHSIALMGPPVTGDPSLVRWCGQLQKKNLHRPFDGAARTATGWGKVPEAGEAYLIYLRGLRSGDWEQGALGTSLVQPSQCTLPRSRVGASLKRLASMPSVGTRCGNAHNHETPSLQA
ncbi:hypothetical protein NDU88_003231 [Pleurodeles waltl]|uniref:Uncharacterized protein n=1 Tax=Pleurodeles waltl TaxID=8319 RepID=A0AAV7M2U4_PLEWA|nr:hypothetical protein NDU88_003231 [Pleurodeles waltl]